MPGKNTAASAAGSVNKTLMFWEMVGKMKVETEAAKWESFEICRTDILKDHLL